MLSRCYIGAYDCCEKELSSVAFLGPLGSRFVSWLMQLAPPRRTSVSRIAMTREANPRSTEVGVTRDYFETFVESVWVVLGPVDHVADVYGAPWVR